VLVEFFDHTKGVGAVRRANPIVAKDSDIDTGFILLFEQTLEIENRFRGFGVKPAVGHQMRVAIDDHEKLPPKLNIRGAQLDVNFEKPMYALAFLTFVTLPSLRITARGLIDAKTRRIVPLFAD
jgi:hypothetical protein